MELSDRLMNANIALLNKLNDEIDGVRESTSTATISSGNLGEQCSPLIEDNDELSNDENVEPITFEQYDLCKLGGSDNVERAKRIAEVLFTVEKRRKFCIDPRRKLGPTSEAADDARTEKFRAACKKVLKNFSQKEYRRVLKLVNQAGYDSRRPSSLSATEQDV